MIGDHTKTDNMKNQIVGEVHIQVEKNQKR